MDFYGIYPPVITPYSDDHTINEDGFAAMIEHLITSGVHGIVIGGTTGEYYAQTIEERERMLAEARVAELEAALADRLDGARVQDALLLFARGARWSAGACEAGACA